MHIVPLVQVVAWASQLQAKGQAAVVRRPWFSTGCNSTVTLGVEPVKSWNWYMATSAGQLESLCAFHQRLTNDEVGTLSQHTLY